MESGKPRSRASRFACPSPLRFGAALLLSAALSTACGDTEAAFRSARSSLDSSLDAWAAEAGPERLGTAFAQAERKARSAEDWVSLLKRARRAEALGDRGRYALVAQHALDHGPGSESLLAAEADAFLRGGQPERALALFGKGLSAESRPGLWAEAALASLKAGTLPPSAKNAANLARLAGISGDSRLYIDAAALALSEGDRLAARSWLDKARAGGLAVPVALLWDAGQYEVLAGLGYERPSARQRKFMGDAAWVLGDPVKAERLWRSSLAADPAFSWRNYVSIAALDGGTLSAGQRGLFDDEGDFREMDDAELGGELRLSGRHAESAELYASLLRVFPAERGALVAYAAALARSGKKAEALVFMDRAAAGPGRQVPDATFLAADPDSRVLREWLGTGAALWPEGRLAAEVLRAIELRPDDVRLLDDGLALLFSRGYYDDFLAVHARAEKADIHYPRRVLFDAYAAMARGDLARARTLLESGGEGAGGAEGLFALALLRDDAGEAEEAMDILEKALAVSSEPPVRCDVLKEMGRIADSQGDAHAAKGYYAMAHLADPSDTEAARLSH